jgi:hypothetical protein
MERVHPSRLMSVAERNRRRAVSGWEPPELAERRIQENKSKGTSSPRPGATTSAGRGPCWTGVVPDLLSGLGSVKDPAWPSDRDVGEDGYAAPGTGDAAGIFGSSRGWFAAYLSAFPAYAAIPRSQLRTIANARCRSRKDRPLPLSQGRQLRQRLQGLDGSSKGRRSSQELAGHLRAFEELGLVRRDTARDAVIVTDPRGLRRLADAPAGARSGVADQP